MNISINKKLKALVVEDQELFRDAVAEELAFFGFEASTAVDGEDGLKAAVANDFDLILSDMRMPNKDGRWLLSELRKSRKSSPPFIFMTGFSDLSIQDAFELGADGILGKPLNSERLEVLLTKVCKPADTRWSDVPQIKPTGTIARTFESSGPKCEVNFGRGGMFIALDQVPLKCGDLLSFDLRFKSGPILQLQGSGTVVWRRDASGNESSGYGIDFDHISSGSLPGWLKFLAEEDRVPLIPNGRSLN